MTVRGPRLLWLPLAVGIALFAAGCRDGRTPTDGNQASPESSVNANNSSSAASTTGLGPTLAADQIVDVEGLKQVVARHRGKVVYLDFWATWCAPCVEALPELANIQKRYGERGLQVVAVSFDDPKHWIKKIRPTLKRAEWDGPSYVVRDRKAQNAIVEWLGDEWRSELPARYIIDRSGQRAYEIIEYTADRLPSVDDMLERVLKK